MAKDSKMQIFAVVITALAVIVLMGLALVSQYSRVLRINQDMIGANMTLLTNTNVALGTTGEFPFAQTISVCVNSSNVSETIPAANYSVVEGDGDGGFILYTATAYNASRALCNGTFLNDTAAQGSADNFVAGLAIFGTFAAVIVLAMVGKIIIGLFRKGKDKGF